MACVCVMPIGDCFIRLAIFSHMDIGVIYILYVSLFFKERKTYFILINDVCMWVEVVWRACVCSMLVYLYSLLLYLEWIFFPE